MLFALSVGLYELLDDYEERQSASMPNIRSRRRTQFVSESLLLALWRSLKVTAFKF